MKQIKEHVRYILEHGIDKPGRSGQFDTPDASLSVFARQLRFDLNEGLPFTTGKKLQIQSMLKEITWFLRGETNTQTLGCSIWDKWALKNDLGVRTAIPEVEVIKALMEKKPELKDKQDASMYLVKLLARHIKPQEGKPFINPDEINTIEDLLALDAQVDYAAVDAEINAMGIETTTLNIRHKKGECGPIYGEQWRNFQSVALVNGQKGLYGIDQLMVCYDLLDQSMHSRRILVDSWNPGLVPKSSMSVEANIANGNMSLPPCHMLFQFYVGKRNDQWNLNLNLRLRSSDTGLGLGFNVGSYAVINSIFAAEFNLGLGELVVDMCDAHIYKGHIEGLKTYLERPLHKLPTMNMSDYEERKKAWLLKLIDASIPDDEDKEYARERHINRIFADTPEAKRTRFKMLIDTIDYTFFDGMIENYVSEPAIPLDLYD